MSNYNFADWELTQLLPEKHTFSEWYIDSKNNLINNSCINTFKDIFSTLPVWSWEDIRLYLEERGYILKISPYVDIVDEKSEEFQILYYFDIIYSSTGECENDCTYYHSYEEVRKEAIIYCLNQINNE